MAAVATAAWNGGLGPTRVSLKLVGDALPPQLVGTTLAADGLKVSILSASGLRGGAEEAAGTDAGLGVYCECVLQGHGSSERCQTDTSQSASNPCWNHEQELFSWSGSGALVFRLLREEAWPTPHALLGKAEWPLYEEQLRSGPLERDLQLGTVGPAGAAASLKVRVALLEPCSALQQQPAPLTQQPLSAAPQQPLPVPLPQQQSAPPPQEPAPLAATLVPGVVLSDQEEPAPLAATLAPGVVPSDREVSINLFQPQPPPHIGPGPEPMRRPTHLQERWAPSSVAPLLELAVPPTLQVAPAPAEPQVPPPGSLSGPPSAATDACAEEPPPARPASASTSRGAAAAAAPWSSVGSSPLRAAGAPTAEPSPDLPPPRAADAGEPSAADPPPRAPDAAEAAAEAAAVAAASAPPPQPPGSYPPPQAADVAQAADAAQAAAAMASALPPDEAATAPAKGDAGCCPKCGEALAPWVTNGMGYCDCCGRRVQTGELVMDCSKCNWFLCSACSPAEAHDDVVRT